MEVQIASYRLLFLHSPGNCAEHGSIGAALPLDKFSALIAGYRRTSDIVLQYMVDAMGTQGLHHCLKSAQTIPHYAP